MRLNVGWTANLIADAQYLPFKDKSFDELRIHEVLEHIPNWRKALSECCRVARKISITVPVDSNILQNALRSIVLIVPTLKFFKSMLGLPKRTREHLWQFDTKMLTRRIEQLGFKVVETNAIHRPIFAFVVYGWKEKYLGRSKKPYRWKIIAEELSDQNVQRMAS